MPGSRSPLLLLLPLLGGVALAGPRAAPPGDPPPADAPLPGAPLPDAPRTDAAAAPPAAPDTAPVRTFVAAFDEALSVRADLLLEGVDAEADVPFTVPASWELVEDPVLELDYAHSAALLPDRSHLTVSLGDASVGSTRLDASTALGGRLRIPLPRELLTPYTHLRLRAVQHYGTGCEDPFDPGLWTRIARSSRVVFRYRERPVVPDLAAFPAPLVDPTAYGPVPLSLVLPHNPSAPTIEALGRIGFSFGRLADWRGIDAEAVPTVGEAAHHALLVGLWAESPAIRALLGDVAPRPGQGLVALVPNPEDATRAVLVVTGIDPEGLGRAARAVASHPAPLSGASARIDDVTDAPPPPSRRDPRPAPAASTFALSDLGLPDRTARGFYTPTLAVPLVLEGDATLRPGEASALLRYSYAAGLDPRLSAMEVRLDGVTLKSVALDDPDGETGATVRVPLPDGLVTPRSTLDVGFTLFPKDWSACVYASDATAWATLHADSTLSLPRDRVADLPDLGRLRHGLWPFTLDATAPVLVALPDRPGAADVTAGFLVAAAFGRWSTVPVPHLRLASAAGLDFPALADTHLVLLASGGPHALYDGLVRTRALSVTPGVTRELRAAGRHALTARVADTDALVAEVLHPQAPDRAALVLAASPAVPLPDLVVRVTSPEGLAALDGDVALVGPTAEVRSLALAERRRVGTLPVGVALVALVRSHWALLGVALVTAAVGLALARRAWTRSREE